MIAQTPNNMFGNGMGFGQPQTMQQPSQPMSYAPNGFGNQQMNWQQGAGQFPTNPFGVDPMRKHMGDWRDQMRGMRNDRSDRPGMQPMAPQPAQMDPSQAQQPPQPPGQDTAMPFSGGLLNMGAAQPQGIMPPWLMDRISAFQSSNPGIADPFKSSLNGAQLAQLVGGLLR